MDFKDHLMNKLLCEGDASKLYPDMEALNKKIQEKYDEVEKLTGIKVGELIYITDTGNPVGLTVEESKTGIGTINIDKETSTVWYYTSNATANHTLNFRYNSSTTLNSKLSTGESVTFVWINTNGATPYYPNVIQVDGNTITPKFTGGTAYTAGNASSIDMYQYSIIKTANATFTIFAAQVKYA
jgi:hypothetical protein